MLRNDDGASETSHARRQNEKRMTSGARRSAGKAGDATAWPWPSKNKFITTLEQVIFTVHLVKRGPKVTVGDGHFHQVLVW